MITSNDLSGHSGCKLSLYSNGIYDRPFVRKSAGRLSYNNRLKKQYIKQKMFKCRDVKTPEVFSFDIDEKGIVYFDMEYIEGMTMAEYMNQIKIKDISYFVDLLFNVLPIDNCKYPKDTQKIFMDKILSLKNSLDLSNVKISNALNLLMNFNFGNVPTSACHGDCTLENIIISDKGIYVIDLLDSFYNSWMIDVAKLLQDIELGWSYRNKGRDFNLNLRLATAKQELINKIRSLKNGQENLIMIYHILLLNVLRIYPYTKDDLTYEWLNNSTNTILNKIEKEYK